MGAPAQLKGLAGTAPGTASEDCWLRLNADALHDLSSPVNQIGTLAELIVKKYRGVLGEEAETLFGFLQTSVGRLQNLVGGLNTYLRVAGAPGARRLCESDLLLTAARASVQPAIDQNGAVVTHDPLPQVYGDPNQIGYAFRSLLENAIKFRREQRPEVHISAAEAGDTWIFSVRDNGIGIDPAYRDRIFGVFKRLHNEDYRGAGIGLATTRQIVEEHGGRIWVESQLGLGSTFFFSLPRAAS
ncbi:MAG: ATP-binding protein [Bryobacteraceae bacterium]|jgi:chemotaxis family two-component system sensor kinase Cph1